jgi:catechol 2,3-dioxygenase-like lactoylglutathione lyase family enzyme
MLKLEETFGEWFVVYSKQVRLNNIPFETFMFKSRKMAVCIPFLSVSDIEKTVIWYEGLGFRCTGSNRFWEPEAAALTWAQLEWENAAFMVFAIPPGFDNEVKNAGLYFRVGSMNDLIERLQSCARIIEINEEPFTGRKEVVFEDLNGFRITFSCG